MFHFIKTAVFEKPELPKEAAGASRGTNQNNIIRASTVGFPCYVYSIQQDTAGYGRIRQDTAGYGRIRQDMAGYGRIEQDTARYGRIRQEGAGYCRIRRIRQNTAGYGRIRQIRQDTAVYGMIRQNTTGYGRIRQDQQYLLVRTTKTTLFRSFSVRWYFILFLPAYCDVSS